MERMAVLGTDVSIVWEEVSSVNFSRSGMSASDGSLGANGPRLYGCFSMLSETRGSYVPFQGLVLYIAMLVIQSLQQAVSKLCGRSTVCLEKGRGLTAQDGVEVVQGHVSQVGIGVVELSQQGEDVLLGYLAVCHGLSQLSEVRYQEWKHRKRNACY